MALNDNYGISISDTQYAKKRGDLMKLISSLRSIGAQADLDLPRIVCIGNQSAGKSSLIEAISQIRVPRDSGTCTRCPMECRLSSADDGAWSANITLRIEYDSTGNRLPETKSFHFGAAMSDPASVEPSLRRAQAAILNWGTRSYDEFLDMGEETLFNGPHIHEQLKFSKNVVCIAISGPKLTDLVFIDLPGLIQNAEEDMIKLVEGTVTEQIAGNSIILVTIPMSDDLENQKAALLAKKQDPQGLRTIGVLTKPDTLTTGATRSREAWLDVIEGRKHALTHGYYCTRQPEDSDRAKGISFDEARQHETDFFLETPPWSTSLQTDRFGTQSLTEKLSVLLSQRIDESLPNLQSDLKFLLDRTSAELAMLPPPLLKDPSSELMALVTKFCTSFEAFVEGKRGSERLIQENCKAYTAFKIAIRRSAPDFRPFETALDSTGDDIDASELIGDEPLPKQYTLFSEPMYLRDVRAHINRARTRELPNNIPFPAKVALIERFTCAWENPITDCFRNIQEQVSTTLMRLITTIFGRFSHLQSKVRTIITNEIETCIRDTKTMLSTILKFERFPYTQNDHYYQVCREKFLAHYKAVRAGLIKDAQAPAKRRRLDAAEMTASPSHFGLRETSSPRPASGNGAEQNGTESGDETASGPATPGTFSFTMPASQQRVTGSNLDITTRPTKPLAPTFASAQFSFPSRTNVTAVPQVSSPVPFKPQVSNCNPLGSFNSLEHQNDALAALAKLGIHVQASDLQKLIPSDPWEDEMTVAAEVRSYYQTSYKRIIDNVPMTIDNTFFRSLAERMQSSLILSLGLSDAERAAAYMAEDKHVVLKREELSSRKRRLEGVRQELFKYGY